MTCIDALEKSAALCAECLEAGNKILLCGNGGSAADSQHIAAEFVGRFMKERKGLPAIALTTDTSILTAIGNDYGYEDVFRRQVEALGKAGDLIIGISTSGNSKNIIKAFYEAKENMDLAEDMLKFLINYALENCYDDIEFLNNMYDKELIARLRSVIEKPFTRLTYTEAIEVLTPKNATFEYQVEWG